MVQKQIPNKREEYVVKIGPLLYKILLQQLESIKEVTYGVCKSSLYESGEIVAKKYNNEV